MPRVTTTAASDPVVLADCVAEWLERSDERDRYLQRIIAAEITGYRRGRAAGYDEGYQACAAQVKAIHRALYGHLTGVADLQRRRWGKQGRAHFADPRPGDYPGNGAA